MLEFLEDGRMFVQKDPICTGNAFPKETCPEVGYDASESIARLQCEMNH